MVSVRQHDYLPFGEEVTGGVGGCSNPSQGYSRMIAYIRSSGRKNGILKRGWISLRPGILVPLRGDLPRQMNSQVGLLNFSRSQHPLTQPFTQTSPILNHSTSISIATTTHLDILTPTGTSRKTLIRSPVGKRKKNRRPFRSKLPILQRFWTSR